MIMVGGSDRKVKRSGRRVEVIELGKRKGIVEGREVGEKILMFKYIILWKEL